MNVYFTYSQDLSGSIISQIGEIIRSFGYEVLHRFLPDNLNKLNVKESEVVFKNSLKSVQQADIIVAEVSHACMGVAYEISIALEQRKPVLVLCNLEEVNPGSKNMECIPPHIKGNTSKYLILKEYKMRILQKSVELGLKDAKSMVNSKFLLIIPHEIDVYLEWCVKGSSYKRSTKSYDET
jgi:nucleoside 2-deoxyribosyltransferase